MKKLLLLLLRALVFGMTAATTVRADCDTPDPSNPTFGLRAGRGPIPWPEP